MQLCVSPHHGVDEDNVSPGQSLLEGDAGLIQPVHGAVGPASRYVSPVSCEGRAAEVEEWHVASDFGAAKSTLSYELVDPSVSDIGGGHA